jgi:hypothetical protein
LFFKNSRAQLLTELGEHHNQFFVGTGYTESFANITYGINHQRYFKRLKKEIVGILDFTSPLSDQYFTRFIFRKGFQLVVYKKNYFRVPVALVTSSVKKKVYYFGFHNIITDLYILPGIYKEKYTIAADLSCKVLLLHRIHHDQINSDPEKKIHRLNFTLGIILAHNIQRFSFIFRGGFQQISDWEFTKAPFYANGTVAFKLNFKKHKVLPETNPQQKN